MRKLLSYLPLSIALWIVFPIIVPAAVLPSLTSAENIKTGTLQDGIHYYIVTNDAQKDYASVSLVRTRGWADEYPAIAGEGVVRSRGAISDLPRFTVSSPMQYLSGAGVVPGSQGYVEVSPGATIFSFNDLEVTLNPSVVDSTLLMVFDILSRDAQYSPQRYSPSEHAIVVAGDIDASSILGKMEMLSLMIPGVPGSKAKESATVPMDTTDVDLPAPTSKVSILTVEYRSERMSREDMSTVLPLVMSKYAWELGVVLKRRISSAFAKAAIPSAYVDCSYLGTDRTSSDELFRIRMAVPSERYSAACGLVATILADIDKDGVKAGEYAGAQAKVESVFRTRYMDSSLTNSAYVRKCISSFLYGTALSSPSAELKFFTEKDMSGETALSLFNNYSKALIASPSTSSVRFISEADSVQGGSVRKIFQGAWSTASLMTTTYALKGADTTFLKHNPPKVKLKDETEEPMVGGKVWTFSNGLKVVYKKVSSDGMFRYCWLLRGGYSSVPDIRAGEGPYIGQMPWAGKIASRSGWEFRDMLQSYGISMDVNVGVSDTRIEGVAPEGRITLLLKSMMMLSNDRTPDKGNYSIFRASELCRKDLAKGTPEYRLASLDSLLAPSSPYSGVPRAEALSEDFPRKADRFLSQQFSKMNDGILIIVGDIGEESLRTALCSLLGGFKTEKVASYRAKTQNEVVSGHKTIVKDGNTPSLDMIFSCPLEYSAENILASEVVARRLKKAVGGAAAMAGWTTSSSERLEVYPEERMFVSFSMTPSDPDGMPASMAPKDSVEEVMDMVRKSVGKVSSKGFSSDEVSRVQKYLTNQTSVWKSDPSYMMRMLIVRYSYGKDLMTRQEDKIKGVTADRLNSILKAICSSSVAEYAIRKRDRAEKVVEPPIPEPERPAALDTIKIPYEISDPDGMATLYKELFPNK